GGSAVQAIGFTIPLSWAVLTVLVSVSVLGFAARAARRRPSAVAGLIALALCALAVFALMLMTTSYYFQKFDQAWAVIMMVSAGSFGHLLRRPVLPSRGWKGAAIGVCALLVALGATRSFWWSAFLTKPAVVAANDQSQGGSSWSVSASSSWASVWMSRQYEVPDNIDALAYLSKTQQLADGVPTITVLYADAGSNVNLSLQLAVLNQDAGIMGAVVYGPAADQNRGLNSTQKLLVPCDAGNTRWSSAQQQQLAQLEAGIQAVGKPVRAIVGSQALATTLERWAAAHPGAVGQVLYEPVFPVQPVC
ncbi:MAG TPA: hypothetical protein VH372_05040, partial [Actinospica sp.]|nr:hypothetical protein [Actinospica sp.]